MTYKNLFLDMMQCEMNDHAHANESIPVIQVPELCDLRVGWDGEIKSANEERPSPCQRSNIKGQWNPVSHTLI